MKRTPLHRKTPLARSGHLKRTPIRRKPRPPEDRVDPRDHLAVRLRDGMCFGILVRIVRAEPHHSWVPPDLRIPWHQCADTFGNQHPANAIDLLTVDHFHLEAGGAKSKRAKSDRLHMVAMCGALNGRPPGAAIREAERAYSAFLAGVKAGEGG